MHNHRLLTWSVRGFIFTHMYGGLASTRRHSGSCKPPQILAATLAIDALARFSGDPVCNLRAGPNSAIWSWTLQRLPELVFQQRCEQAGRTATLRTPIHKCGSTRRAVALGDLPDRAWAVARRRLNLGKRRLVR